MRLYIIINCDFKTQTFLLDEFGHSFFLAFLLAWLAFMPVVGTMESNKGVLMVKRSSKIAPSEALESISSLQKKFFSRALESTDFDDLSGKIDIISDELRQSMDREGHGCASAHGLLNASVSSLSKKTDKKKKRKYSDAVEQFPNVEMQQVSKKKR